jgi:hypothetical protein
MRVLRRNAARPWILLVAAAITLLPPGAWSLCLNRTSGHVAIEPTSAACGEALAAPAAAESACESASHDACEDYVLQSGHLATGPRFSVPTQAPLEGVLAGRWDLRPIGVDLCARSTKALLHTPPPATAPNILRC